MPHPYPGQEWKHGWKPVTPSAAKSKNHGRAPTPGSKGSKLAKSTSGSKDSSPTDSRTTSQRMDDAIRAKTGRGRSDSTPARPASSDTPLRKEALDREASNPFGKSTIARDPDDVKVGQSVWAGNRWVKVKTEAEGKELSRFAGRHLSELGSKEAPGPRLRDEAQDREAKNPFGKNTIARDPNNIKIGQSVWAGNKWVKVKNDADAKALSRYASRHLSDLRLGNPTVTAAAKPSSPADDVAEAAKAIKAGNTAQAVNHLTKAMNNAKGAEREAIKKQRTELSRRLMGR